MTPEGWEQTALGEIASIERGKFSHRPRNDPRFFGGKYPFVQTGDVATCGGLITRFSQTLNEEGLAVSRLFPAGTIVITIAANIGDTGIAQFPIAFPDSLVGIQAGPRVDCRYLEFSLRSRKKALEEAAPQNAQKNINLETLRPLTIPLPPLPEQRKIAAILSSVDEAIEGTQAVIDQLQVVKKAMMADLLTRGIPGRHKSFKQTEIGEIPGEWSFLSLNEVLSFITYGFTNPMPTTKEGPWMVTAANVRDGWIDWDSARRTSRIAYDSSLTQKSKPILGDVLVTKDGSLGRVAIVDRDDVCINQSVALLRPAADVLLPTFLAYCLRAPAMQDRILADVGGSTIKHIYISKLSEMPVPVPSIAEQRAITEVLDAFEARQDVERARLQALKKTKSALMYVLLTGEVRVKVDEEAAA